MGLGLDPLDIFVVATAFASFILFLVVHVVVSRYLRPASSLKVLMQVFGLGLLANGVVSLGPTMVRTEWLAGYTSTSIVVGTGASLLIYATLVFNYVIGVFNLGETARRIRLLRELYQAPSQAMTLNEVYQAYNAEMILNVRLSRLVASGQLNFDGERYRLGGRFFLAQARLLWMMKRVVGIPEDRF